MTASQPMPLSISSPADVLALVPHLLGYQPGNSLVLIATVGTKVVLACRTDLPVVPEDLPQLLPSVQAVDSTHVIIVGYGPAPAVDPALAAAHQIFTVAGLAVHDALRVDDGRYWSLLCTDTDCCPPDGTPFDADINPLAVHAVVAGSSPFADRASLEASVAPLTGPGRAAMTDATIRARHRLTTLAAATVRAEGRTMLAEAATRYQQRQQCTDDEVAWLTVLLTIVPVRDHAWYTATHESWHLDLWRDLTRRADPDLSPAPASLLAFTAWRAGDGTLANIAVDRALAADPRCQMALLVGEALRAGMPPSALAGWGNTPTSR
ncbi:DUF4192 domain-containing protein [Polymorphospora sp. NPDC050346]|uniref:DUF4192 domain-containing protein n=1 Tax=Polymorphospora sp. NPDC050346 TaxID=3155780 RepID=UPI0033D617A5